ncbi:S41 family peptidase [Flavobacterium sp. RHBU_3]|uniref:S41 family peptidase n=1 Tax=Flavobacterium sp. RHBU_3 TaxID=3391184 RepID=UPI0039854EF5
MKLYFHVMLLITAVMSAQDNRNACRVFARINTLMQEKHYSPKPLDDSLSVYVFNTVIDQLDDNHILFTEDEYNSLLVHKTSIDDYIKQQKCSFFDGFINTYRTALLRNKKYIEEIAAEKLTYNTTDTIFYSKKVYPFVKDPQRIKRYLRKKITYDILEDISELSKNKDSLAKQLPKLFEATKQKVLETYLCRADNLLSPPEGFENSMYNRFYSVFCSYFDPHSTYFNYNERASFVSTISTQSYTLGLYVSQTENEEMVVDEVVPGGPAFNTNKIEKGDRIIKLASNNNEYVVSCASMDAINNIVSSDSYKNVDLTLRKKDGTLYTVTLRKEIMKDDENLVYSYVLGKGNEKYGYIKIPSFYTNYDNSDGNGCAADVATEVLKLTKQDIKGIIIDLQYNGGGSMDEVIQLCGMFINYGPVAVLTDRQMKYNTLRDYNRGMVYDGPLVVLVNAFSASASEFFAGVIQDYNRGIIAGSPTHGKASMQNIIPVEENDNNDFIKITVDRFYRVSGKSSQYTGILPDVELPMLFSPILPREKGMANALKNDSIDVHLRYTKLPEQPLNEAIFRSKERVVKNTSFTTISNLNNRINLLYNNDRKKLPVTFTAVYDDVHSTDGLYKEIKDNAEKENVITVTGTYTPQGSEAYVKSVNDFKIKGIKTDPYVFEGMNILYDLSLYKKR